MKHILIIGAGFSGTVIAARLLRQTSSTSMCVHLINGSGRVGRGMAYGTQSPDHVLNVPAGNMSAFDDLPDHFLEYARNIDHAITSGSFVSRRIYGDYLENLLNEAERTAAANIELNRIYHQVTHINTIADESSSMVTLDTGEVLKVDKVVLALGHFQSSHLPLSSTAFYESKRYLHDPWDNARLDAISARASVVLLGTGLTAVDVAMTLLSRNPDRKITAISRRGLLAQAHRHSAGKAFGTGAESIWGRAQTVRVQLREFRRYCRVLAEMGRDWREGMALLRPFTADVWQAYSEKERRRFLRHVQPYWDTHRHRLAPMVSDRFEAALANGSVRTLAGRIIGFDRDGDDVHVSLRPRGKEQTHVERTQYVINCTGPCADPRQVRSQLVQQLLSDGLMRADRLGLGIDVAPDCALISATGHPSRGLFYIGPWLKANYWEATAVPDLRVIAKQLASRIMQDD